MNQNISFCANQECSNLECLRYYKKAPQNRIYSWFGVTPKEDGTCDCYLEDDKGEILSEC